MADPGRREEELRRVWRWTASVREWAGTGPTDIRGLNDGDIKRLVEQLSWPVANRYQHIWALRLLIRAA